MYRNDMAYENASIRLAGIYCERRDNGMDHDVAFGMLCDGIDVVLQANKDFDQVEFTQDTMNFIPSEY